jgi:uncharacterized membrane protein YkoI
MNIKAAIFSTIAIVGTAWLLWASYQGINGLQHERGDDEAEEYGVGETGHEQDSVRRMQQHGDILPLEQILRKADEQHAGRVLESELERNDGDYVYDVEVVDDQGRVWEMRFDARSGEVLNQEQEN